MDAIETQRVSDLEDRVIELEVTLERLIEYVQYLGGQHNNLVDVDLLFVDHVQANLDETDKRLNDIEDYISKQTYESGE